MNAPKRKPNSEARRRELCDAAIELLADDGARGLTHLRVDRHAGSQMVRRRSITRLGPPCCVVRSTG